jgi:hypothetical protein
MKMDFFIESQAEFGGFKEFSLFSKPGASISSAFNKN